MTVSMNERRQVSRQRTYKGGTLTFGASPPLECIVRNHSSAGACLELPNDDPVPDSFALLIKPERIMYRCRIVWRIASRIGVRFI
jgi:hypothetical protein